MMNMQSGCPDSKTETQSQRTTETPEKEFAKPWMERFIAYMSEGGHARGACRAARIGRTTAYRYRQSDEDFALAWADAEEESTERLEEEAFRRACEGLKRNKYDAKGNLLCEELVYSDTLAIFLLKARRPEKYRDRYEFKHSGEVKTTGVDLSKLSLEEARELQALLEKASRDKVQV